MNDKSRPHLSREVTLVFLAVIVIAIASSSPLWRERERQYLSVETLLSLFCAWRYLPRRRRRDRCIRCTHRATLFRLNKMSTAAFQLLVFSSVFFFKSLPVLRQPYSYDTASTGISSDEPTVYTGKTQKIFTHRIMFVQLEKTGLSLSLQYEYHIK